LIERIQHEGRELALIVRHSFTRDGVEFFTPDESSQQMGYMKRGPGYVISPHVHQPVLREVACSGEVLFIKSGRVRVDFYTQDRDYLESTVLTAGDVILLANGGHGFEMLDETEIIEVKQGPYVGDTETTRFAPIAQSQVKIRTPR
jgi:hypothetical protein